ncbi:hypothetical protein [Mycolicibacter sinensis]|uniref:Lipoprotein n=1 Tax=Mycolicibacter sinensis (strain JDM601) TaxID=875328 RepID=A0A1A2XVQ4_MYCSD|nr:hypothetical protein [Mycolicibacter sinensis]OBI29845.1 hypothetical protein A5710_20850 [Mycolicibacter sinensis]
MITKTFNAIAATAGAAVITAACAHADAPTFPDISGYTPVTASDYIIEIPNTGRAPIKQVYFLTPDGITCDFSAGQAQCTGNNFPSVPPAQSDPSRGITGANWVGTMTGLKQTNAPIAEGDTVQGQPIKTLPPLHSIAVDGVICAVDDAGTTACKDPQNRGFVLSPHGSGWFPHV